MANTFPEIPQPGARRAALKPTLLVLGITLLLSVALAPVMRHIGQQWENQRHYLDNCQAPDEYQSQLAFHMQYAVESNDANDVIFLGDSTCLCDIEPVVFEKETGMRAYNMGTMGVIGMRGYRVVLETYLQHHPKPKVIVLCVSPSAIGVNPTTLGPEFEQKRFMQFYAGGSGPFEPIEGNPLIAQIRRGIMVTFGQATGGFEHYANQPIPFCEAETYNHLRDKVFAERGYWELPLNIAGLVKPAIRESTNPQDPFPMLPDCLEQMGELAKFTDRQGIILMVRLSPVAPCRVEENDRKVDESLACLEAINRRTRVIRPAVLNYDCDLFFQVNHTNRRGADAFTRRLAIEVIENMRATP